MGLLYPPQPTRSQNAVALLPWCDDYIAGVAWNHEDGSTEKVFWMRPDHLDKPDPYIQRTPELYNFDAVAYETIMLGMVQIHYGPENNDCKRYGVPKITEL